MKTDIHPEYKEARIVCACGNVIETRSTVEEIHVEICSSCHPFFTGKQKLVDTAGRVEKFRAKYGLESESGKGAEVGAAEAEELDPADRAEALQKAREELAEESGEAEEGAEETVAEAEPEAAAPKKASAKKKKKKKKAAKASETEEAASEA